MKSVAGLVLAAGLAAAPFAAHAEVRVLLESDSGQPGGSELYLVNYADQAALAANTIQSQFFLPLDVNNGFGVGDFAYANGAYHVLLESDAPASGGSELYLVNYASYADLVSNTISSQFFLPLDMNNGFGVGGFTFDGSQFSLVLESDSPQGGGNELYLVNYASYADLVSNTISSQFFLPLDVNNGFGVGGFAFNKGAYELILESDSPQGSGNELYFVRYASYADLVSNTISDQFFLPLDVNNSFGVGGFEYEYAALPPGGGVVPEPATWATLLAGFAMIGVLERRRRLSPAGARRSSRPATGWS